MSEEKPEEKEGGAQKTETSAVADANVTPAKGTVASADANEANPKEVAPETAVPSEQSTPAPASTDLWSSFFSAFSPAKPTEEQVEAKVDEAALKFKSKLRSMKKNKDAGATASAEPKSADVKEGSGLTLDQAQVELGDLRKKLEESQKKLEESAKENDRLSKDLSAAKAKSTQMEDHIKDLEHKESIVNPTTLAVIVLVLLVTLGAVIAVTLNLEPVGLWVTKELLSRWEGACDCASKCPAQEVQEEPSIGLMGYLFGS